MKLITSTILLLLWPTLALADVVWPALYAETKINSIPIIGLSLLIEYCFFKWVFELDIKKAIIITIIVNSVSGLVGLFLRPVFGIIYEVFPGSIINHMFDWGTFNPVGWISVPIIGGLVNAILELFTIYKLWKSSKRKYVFLCTWIINSITVALATLWVILQPPQL